MSYPSGQFGESIPPGAPGDGPSLGPETTGPSRFDFQPGARAASHGSRKRLYVGLGLAGGALLFIVFLAVLVTSLGKGKVFEDAVAACGLGSNEYAAIGDDGTSLSLDMAGSDDWEGLEYSDVGCVLDELEMPDSVENRMGQTRSLDGMQDATWDDIRAAWTYHPDSGLDVILETE